MKKLLVSLLLAFSFLLGGMPLIASASSVLPEAQSSALVSGCTPQITSVSSFASGSTPNVSIKGSCFGTNNTFSGNDSQFLRITIRPSTPSEWHACSTLDSPIDSVTCNVPSWTDTSITLSGFTGQYGQNGWVVNNGDTVLIDVWNPQTNQGPSACTVVVGATGTTQCLPSAAELAKQILSNPNIDLDKGRCVRKDIVNTSQGRVGTAGKPLSPVLLSDLLAIASSQKVIVTAIESCGTGHGGPKDRHFKGLAMDLAPGSGNTLANIARTIYNNRVSWRIDQLIFDPMPKGTTTLLNGKSHTYNAKTRLAHRNHVHFSVMR